MPTAQDFQESEYPTALDFQESECPQLWIFRNLNAHSSGFSGI